MNTRYIAKKTIIILSRIVSQSIYLVFFAKMFLPDSVLVFNTLLMFTYSALMVYYFVFNIVMATAKIPKKFLWHYRVIRILCFIPLAIIFIREIDWTMIAHCYAIGLSEFFSFLMDLS